MTDSDSDGIRVVGGSMPPPEVLSAMGSSKLQGVPSTSGPTLPPLGPRGLPPSGSFFSGFGPSSQEDDEGDDIGGEYDDEDFDDFDEDEDEECTPESEAQRAMLEEEQKGGMIARIAKIKSNNKIQGPVMTRLSSLDDVRFELQRLESELVLRQSVKVQRRVLMAVASGLEFAHSKTPIRGKLVGWSEAIMANIDSYDDVFDRLHRKHAPKLGFGKGKPTEPELELAMMVGYSAFSFALTNTMMQLGKPAGANAEAGFSLPAYKERKEAMGLQAEESRISSFPGAKTVTFGKTR
jgi:hypothetical protein